MSEVTVGAKVEQIEQLDDTIDRFFMDYLIKILSKSAKSVKYHNLNNNFIVTGDMRKGKELVKYNYIFKNPSDFDKLLTVLTVDIKDKIVHVCSIKLKTFIATCDVQYKLSFRIAVED